MQLAKNRREEIYDIKTRFDYRQRILRYSDKPLDGVLEVHENVPYFGVDLPIEQQPSPDV